MQPRIRLLALLALAFTLPIATLMFAQQANQQAAAVPPRPAGPCDVYAEGDCPCVAAHSSTRALFAAYNGPLYQVMRQSDGKTLDIGVVRPSAGDPGGYADAASQDEFCANTVCWVTTLYDQAGNDNHLVQAPRGGFGGPAMGGFNNLPIADMAPVTLMGHKVYGVFIEPGMGLRWNDARGTAVDDQAEGQYWVINGHHYNSGCCFDYGNGETDSRDDGNGTMETTYYGNASSWYTGQGPGPWIMTDQENNLVGCVNPDGSKNCADLPTIGWRFVTATADGEPHRWRSMGGDSQQGELAVMFDGARINDTYDPMRKQGAVIVGNGGDNSNGSQGTFYEGAMTAPGTFPSNETNQKIQANVVAARYGVQRLSVAPAWAVATPPGLQTFAPGSSQETTVTFTNTSGEQVTDVRLGVALPEGWSAVAKTAASIPGAVAPGQTVSATFEVTSGAAAFNGDLVGTASWTNTSTGDTRTETATEKVRNVSPVKINEFRISGANSTDSFIELYNAGSSQVDISGWRLTQHATQQPAFSAVEVPPQTTLAPKSFYVMGLSNSGLAAAAKQGESTLYVRSTEGMSEGDEIQIGSGASAETHKIASIKTPAAPAPQGGPGGGFGGGFGRRGGPRGQTTLWQPIPDGPVITIPTGSTNVPVASVDGFEVGQKLALGYGATYPTVAQAIEKYEVVTITEVGKAGTQAWLSMDAKAGDTNIKVSSVENISVGDKIRLDIDSVGHGIETVTVTKVGTASVRNTFNGPLRDGEDAGTGLELAEPLKFDHASNMPFSARGTGITFEPATSFEHSSNEPVLALASVIELDQPLAKDHAVDAVVRDDKVTTAGYQGTPPDQWFGGPALSASAGAMVLRDADGLVVDSLNYGLLVDPWAAEGYQGVSGARQNGCLVAAPTSGRGGGFGGFGGRGGGPPAATPEVSVGRYPDGADTDSNCTDFKQQTSTTLASEVAAGAKNIKVANTADLAAGQSIVVGSGDSQETVLVESVGTAGAATIAEAVEAGATRVSVSSVAGFVAGQEVTIGGADGERVVITAIDGGRGGRGRGGFGGGFGGGGRRGGPGGGGATITLMKPLAKAHPVGVQVAGSGVTLSKALANAHESGAPVASGVPTPGAANQYTRQVF